MTIAQILVTVISGLRLSTRFTRVLLHKVQHESCYRNIQVVEILRPIVGAKFVLIGLWTLGLAVWIFLLGLGIGMAVGIPGGSTELAWTSFWYLMLAVLLNCLLMPWVALFASIGRGYLPSLGWASLALALAQILTALGWADWFPWAVPALVGQLAGPNAEPVAIHSFGVVLLTFIAGVAATLTWWRSADQAR